MGTIRKTIAAGIFKARCLKLLDEVAETGQEIVVTKRGKAVARLAPLTPEIALAAGGPELGLHGDPADRMIAATALGHGARLVTKDEQLQAAQSLDTVW